MSLNSRHAAYQRGRRLTGCQQANFWEYGGRQTWRLACREPSLARVIILSTCFLIAFARTCTAIPMQSHQHNVSVVKDSSAIGYELYICIQPLQRSCRPLAQAESVTFRWQHTELEHLCSRDPAMPQHLCGQAPDKCLPLVSWPAQLGQAFLMSHGKDLAAVLWERHHAAVRAPCMA